MPVITKIPPFFRFGATVHYDKCPLTWQGSLDSIVNGDVTSNFARSSREEKLVIGINVILKMTIDKKYRQGYTIVTLTFVYQWRYGKFPKETILSLHSELPAFGRVTFSLLEGSLLSGARHFRDLLAATIFWS